MRQWVDIKNWTTNYRILSDYISHELEINFDVINPTDLPLTILNTKTITKMRSRTKESWKLHNILLAPNLPYTVTFGSISLDKEEQAGYPSNGIVIVTFGYVLYRDCFEKTREQIFSGLLHCTKTGANFKLEWIPDNPYKPGQQKESQKPQNAN